MSFSRASLSEAARVAALILAISAFSAPLQAAAASTLKTVYSFTGKSGDGAGPIDGLVKGAFGAFYGVTTSGGAKGEGSVFALTFTGSSWTERVIYSFNETLGNTPRSQVIVDSAGALYGTTQHGSSTGQGVVYKLTPPSTANGTWAPSILYKFPGGTPGQEPRGRLLLDSNGVLYGTTYNGGASASAGGTKCLFGCGVVFKLAPPANLGKAWTYSVIHMFRQGNDGSHPVKGLTADTSGALYGTTLNGGSQSCNNGIDLGCGVVFKLTPPAAGKAQWTEQILYRFADNAGGQSTPTDLFLDSAGDVFGGAPTGGAGKVGLIYQLSPISGTAGYKLIKVHNFYEGTGISDLIADSAGDLFGTTNEAGAYGFGTIFEHNAPATSGGPRTYGILYNFLAGGGFPLSNLVQENNGSFLGLTQGGGAHNAGSIYELTP
jgi:uncharacterized repeat protein (TIGR03803 family)